MDGSPADAPHGSEPAASPVSVGEDLPEWLRAWDRYEVLSFLGQGGMGVVYRARDRRLRRIVALKFIRAVSPQLAQRFGKEARAQARINHENICKVFEVGEVSGQKYIAMEYLSGEPLHRASARMTMPQKLTLIKEIAQALHAAHRQGIIHRDIKPANIMVERRPDGDYRPVLMDFGLARDVSATDQQTETGMVMGTPAYMAPEQALGDIHRIDHRSDVYGLGAVLYEMLGGQAPYESQSTVLLLLAVMNEDPVPLRVRNKAVPPDVETIVSKCMNKEPQRRYDSALSLAEDLGRFLAGEPIEARQTTWSYRALRKVQKYRALAALSGLLFLSLTALLAVGIRGRLHAAKQRRQAAEQAALAQRLGQDVKEMELFMRAAYALPLHDISRERRVVRQRMRQIEQMMESLAPRERGPAYYALGRGHLVLHEPEPAQRRLVQSLSSGYETPDVHAALGEALHLVFQQKLEQARRTLDPSALAKRREQLQAELVAPALEHLGHAAAAEAEAQTLSRARASLLRGELAAAVEMATQASAAAPWQAEPLQLQAQAETRMQVRAQGERSYDGHVRQRIALLYAQLTDIARSDPQAHLEECRFWSTQIFIELTSFKDIADSFAHLVSSCQRALRADPELHTARSLLAVGHSYVVRAKQQQGLDIQEDAARAIKLLEQTQQQAADDAAIYVLSNNLNIVVGDYRAHHGLDPRPAFLAAIAAAKQGLDRFPSAWTLHHDLLVTYLHLAAYDIRHARHPEALLQAAAQQCDQMEKLADQAPTLERAEVVFRTAEAADLWGQDPRPFLDKVLPTLRRLLELRPHGDEELGLLREALQLRAARRLGAPGDADALLAEAGSLLDRQIADFPGSLEALLARARLAGLRARALLYRGSSPLAVLDEGAAALAQARKLPSDTPATSVHEAALLLLRAQWLIRQQRPAQELLLRVEQLVLASGLFAGDSILGQLTLAQALRLQAEQRGSAADRLTRAMHAVARARALTPRNPQVDAEEAALQLALAARARPVEQRALTATAQSQLTAALARSPGLQLDYGHLLTK